MKSKSKGKIGFSISSAISLISIISLITIIILNFIGYEKINILKDNIENMYNVDVQKIEMSRTIATDISQIQANVKGQLIEYNSNLNNSIENEIETLNGNIQAYLEMISSEEEKKSSDDFIEIIQEYNDLWKSISTSLNDGIEVDGQEIAMLTVKERTVIDNFNRLVQNNKTDAEEKYFMSKVVTEKAETQFLIK
ncbi:MCP four helix bundle domain-containing protein [uncultured Clostridium sp.]|uniref:MCP four helix bundle domain-containing protein n=1 Tax=uncultured Clostridium sp. TaxID=59620 RepID=UPI0025EE6AA4|nr:MCP four helix bundle domain-containing protein [uncultured Clostridium sp.]